MGFAIIKYDRARRRDPCLIIRTADELLKRFWVAALRSANNYLIDSVVPRGCSSWT